MSFEQSISIFLENEGIHRLLMHILDKADDKPLSKRVRKLSVSIDEKFFPELFYPKSYGDDEILEEAITGLCQHGIFTLKCAPRKKHLPLLERNAKLYFNAGFEKQIRIFYSRPVKNDEWKMIVKTYPFKSQKAKDLLFFRPIKIEGKNSETIIRKFDKWAVQDNRSGTARQESARCFWGLSKVFDNREDIINTFGLKETPVMLNVYSFAAEVNKVLFVENLDTFNAVIESKNIIFSDMAIIYSSGYKASAKRVRVRSGSKIFFELDSAFSNIGKQEFILWFYQDNNKELECFFWGDLDYSGIGILSALKNNFSSIVAWQPGYVQMIESLYENNAHTPKMANKENQTQLSKKVGCEYTDNVLSKVLDSFSLFVDQEIVDITKLN